MITALTSAEGHYPEQWSADVDRGPVGQVRRVARLVSTTDRGVQTLRLREPGARAVIAETVTPQGHPMSRDDADAWVMGALR